MGEEPEVPVQSEKKVVQVELKKIKIAFGILTLIFFAILIGFAWVVSDIHRISEQNQVLIEENNARVTEIQESRTSSCRQTYEGIRQVFKPFFPPPPRTKEQQDSLDLFNETIDGFVAGCTEQTKPDDVN